MLTYGHGGAVSGFTAENRVFPDDRIAVTVLTNDMPAAAAPEIAGNIVRLLLVADQPLEKARDQKARKIFEQLQHGTIDRTLFTADGSSYFTGQALEDFASSLAPLGAPLEFARTGQEERGGMTFCSYRVNFKDRKFAVLVREMPDGKIEQYQLMVEP